MDIHGPNAVCRACGKPPEKDNEYTSLFEASTSDKSCSKDILEIIEILNLNFKPNDGLPQKICFNCLKTLAVISEFRKRCDDLQKILAFYHISLITANIYNETRNKNSLASKSKEISIDISEEEPDNPSNLSIPEIKRETSDEESGMKSSATLPAQDSDDREVTGRPKRKTALACLMKLQNNDFESNVSFADDEEDDYTPNIEVDSSDDLEMHDLNLKDYDVKQELNGSSFQNQFELMAKDLKLETENGDIYLINEASKKDENSQEENDSIILSSDEDMEDLDISDANWQCEFSIDSRDTADQGDNQTIEKINKKKGGKKSTKLENGEEKPKRKMPKKEKTLCPHCNKFFGVHIVHMRNCPARKGHICKYCDSTLGTTEELEEHIEKMHPEGLPACHICFSTFENTHKRSEHIREQHWEARFKCIPCNRTFKAKSTLKEHNARIHTEAINKECPTCHKICKSEFIYQKHQRQHRNAENLKCKFCGKLFTRMQYKTNHERSHTGEKPFLCDACGQSFISRLEINLHQYKKHGYPVKQSYKRLYKPKKPYPYKRKLAAEQFRFKCTLCPREFATTYGLDQHLRKHTEERKYICQQCGNGFKRQVHLTQHIRRIHLKLRNFICTICKKGFPEKFELRNHMYAHKDERPLKCEHCPLTFKRKKLLKSHLAIHSANKQYVCHLCGKAYRYCTNLTMHFQTHTEEEIKLVERKLFMDMEESMENKQIAEVSDYQVKIYETFTEK